MIRRLLISTALLTVAGSALAADLPARGAPVAAAPIFASTWAGAYIGIQGGVARMTVKHTDLDYWYYNLTDAEKSKYSGAIGVKAGYDMQFGSLLAGVGGEVSFGRFRAGGEQSPQGPSYDLRSTASVLGSVRAKLGWATPAFVLYGTAGVAFSNTKHRYFETDGTGEFYNAKGKQVGWVVGIGSDYRLTGNSSIGMDLSHYQFGNKTHELLASDGTRTDYFWRHGDNYQTVMVNYTFRY